LVAHGNLAEQMRSFGPVRGIQVAKAAAPGAVAKTGPGGRELVSEAGCLACHGMTNRIVGPGFTEIASKYRGQDGAESRLTGKVKHGGGGVWGTVPMPAQAQLKDEDIARMVRWIVGGAN